MFCLYCLMCPYGISSRCFSIVQCQKPVDVFRIGTHHCSHVCSRLLPGEIGQLAFQNPCLAYLLYSCWDRPWGDMCLQVGLGFLLQKQVQEVVDVLGGQKAISSQCEGAPARVSGMTREPFGSHTLQSAQKLVKHTQIRQRVQGSAGERFAPLWL